MPTCSCGYEALTEEGLEDHIDYMITVVEETSDQHHQTH